MYFSTNQSDMIIYTIPPLTDSVWLMMSIIIICGFPYILWKLNIIFNDAKISIKTKSLNDKKEFKITKLYDENESDD